MNLYVWFCFRLLLGMVLCLSTAGYFASDYKGHKLTFLPHEDVP